ncbi:MAG: response regulator [Clostridiaceae bacterium]|nr:response regulator [Clostridiaceae bacterium]
MYQVLIVDDEPIVKIALCSMLDWSSLGFHICGTASNGQEALEMAERMHPDLIICDLKMPVMDGIDLIRTAKDRSMNCEFLVISNYEDFHYVRTALVLGASDYILKVSISPEELTTQLQKIKEKLDQKQTHHLSRVENNIEQSFHHQEEHAAWREYFTHKTYTLDDLVAIAGVDTDNLGSLALCEISFDWYAQQLETLPSPDLIRSTLKNALEHFDRRRIIFFSSSSTLLLIQEEELKKHNSTIEGLAARIEQLFRYYMPLLPTIIYQDHVPDLLQARKVYHRFQELLELSFYGELGTMNARHISVATSIPDLTYKQLATKILKISQEERLQRSKEYISNLLSACIDQNVVPDKVIQYFVRLLGELEYQLSEIPASSHDQLVECADFMRNAINQEELEQHLFHALQVMFSPESSTQATTDQYSLEVEQSIAYIKENYMHKISLASVAEHVGLSSGYLCRIFKDETGGSINTHINNLRMNKAGELLCGTNRYIKEIAVAVGFEDQLYFSRLFKRYSGLTPSEYRASKNPQ